MKGNDVIRETTISKCKAYRYTLGRRWDEGPTLVFVGLNPSTADASKDDPTIRRCIRFAEREGFAGLLMLNLFAKRTPKPSELVKAADPVGQKADATLVEHTAGRRVLCCWGNGGQFRGRSQDVLDLLRDAGVDDLVCLGKTKLGEPRHPLYVKADTELVAM